MGWRIVLLWDELMDPQTDCRLMRSMAMLMMVPERNLSITRFDFQLVLLCNQQNT